MADPAKEIEDLRQQVEEFRRSELARLKEQLASATADVLHYRAEAQRNADLGRQIHLEAQMEISRLQERVGTLERLPNGRSTRDTARTV